MNTEVIIHPQLQHLGLTTGNLEPMVEWYRNVLGMRQVYRSDNPTGAPEGGFRPIAVWLSNDEANHRVAIVAIDGLQFDQNRSHAPRMQHVAFSFDLLDQLLGTFVRLKRLGIVPVMAADEGAQTAFYYQDPDRNVIELNVDNYGDSWTSAEHMMTAPEFAKKPLGVYVDPEKMIETRLEGASPWEVHVRAWKGEFAPKEPYNLMAML